MVRVILFVGTFLFSISSHSAEPEVSFTLQQAQEIFNKGIVLKTSDLADLNGAEFKTKGVAAKWLLWMYINGLRGACNSGRGRQVYRRTLPESVYQYCQDGHYYLDYDEEPMGISLNSLKDPLGKESVYAKGRLRPYMNRPALYKLSVEDGGIKIWIENTYLDHYQGKEVKNERRTFDLCRVADTTSRMWICRRQDQVIDSDRKLEIAVEDRGYYIMERI